MPNQPLVGGGDEDDDDDDDEPVEGEAAQNNYVLHATHVCVYNVLAILQEDDPVSDGVACVCCYY